ncbi:MFS transporter [Streptomyces sp. GC420]|uniref:MFS transporter n=1 Tax=Streptomyces sp. GC420 TaxID=2697568 RepID=UPI00141511B9|nr:MFS transporter [Streptomyces sp. GC420]NBM15840.1 MFS transporter [Streptomyces sp. GC420]
MPAPAVPPAAGPAASAPAVPGRLPAVLLMAGSCLPVLGAVLIAPVLPRMQDHFGGVPGSAALVPVVLTVPALSLALLAPFAGVVVDRLGRKRLLVVATSLYALFGTAPLWLDSLHAILISRVLVGVAEAAVMTACTTLIGDYYSGRVRDRYLALQTMSASASATLFFVLGGALGAAGWRAPFWLYALGLLLAPVMARALPAPAPSGAATVPADAATARADAATGPRPFPVRRMAGISLLTFFGAIVFYTVPVEMSYLLDDLDVTSTGAIGAVTAAASAATVAGSVAFTRLTGSPRRRLPALLLLCAAGFLLMAIADSVPLLITGAVVNCVGTGMLLPSLLTLAMSRLDFADRGRGTGLWTAAFFLGEFACPLVLLGGKGALGDLASAVGLLGLATVLVSAALLALTRRAPAAAQPLPAPEQP